MRTPLCVMALCKFRTSIQSCIDKSTAVKFSHGCADLHYMSQLRQVEPNGSLVRSKGGARNDSEGKPFRAQSAQA